MARADPPEPLPASDVDPDRPPPDLILAGEEFSAAAAASPAGLEGVLAVPDEPESPKPPLDALVARIPEQVRERLDALFRARFVQVIRVAPAVLAAGASAERPH